MRVEFVGKVGDLGRSHWMKGEMDGCASFI